MSFETRYKNLNPAQKQAVDTIDGPVMVIAGPGTGKTELLSVRIANILKKTDTLPENILCLTFTESGQAAMRERLVGIIGKDAYKVAIHTFHSFGSEIMSQNREYFYQSAVFEAADELKQYEVLRGIFEELDYTNPLSSMNGGEYTHLSDAQKVISELKRSSALTSDELLAVIDQSDTSLDSIERILGPIFEERVSKMTAAKLQEAYVAVRAEAAITEPIYQVTPLAHIIADSLEAMLVETDTVHPTKPITAWKSRWMERNDAKKLVFKDRKRLSKLRSLAYVYYEYLARMEKLGLYDFDDMIMQVVHAIEVHDDLRYNLQEKYLYLMVDEFQDTNLAQLRILHNLTDNPVNEGAPNVLVVGDDDQAIYGFQGADSSNIITFSETYPSRQLIVLTDNYRSGAAVLDTSRAVIQQGGDRLESRIPELNKQLAAKRGQDATVALWHAPSISAEREAIIEGIQKAIKEGVEPGSIAVLARRHADIQSLLPYFSNAGIAVRYEREESVLESPPIVALEHVAKVVLALAGGHHDQAEALLPELLAHPAWDIPAKDLWRLSLDAYTNRQPWMEVMASTPRFVPIHEWLIERASEVTTNSLEAMIDSLIGKPADDETPASPYFTYYFSTKALEDTPEQYLECLTALRAIRTRLREYSPGSTLYLKDFIAFIDLHQRLGIGISASRYSLSSDTSAVQLLTAHKSKGLEFDTVYVFNAADAVWGQGARGGSRSISYPENLPLAPTGNTADERLRLFYVAMTRARNDLIMTYSDRNDADKQTLLADFLVAVDTIPTHDIAEPTEALRVESAELAWYQLYTEPTTELKTLLAPQLEKFKLSATSLNGFLDVSRGGPEAFLLDTLLHFPKAKSPSAAYGTAVHRTMQQAHTHLVATDEQKPLEDSLRDFEVALTKERLSEKDYAQYLQQGSDHLTTFLTSGAVPITKTQKAEASFSYQDVRIGDACVTGSLDVLDVDEQERTIIVTDYKTGKPSLSWDKGDDRTKLKLHKYRQQLLFYKLLVEQSSTYGAYTVTHGQLAFIEPTKAGETIVLNLDLTDQDLERTRLLIQAVWKHVTSLSLPDTSRYSPDLKGVLAFEQDLIDGLV
jgi:DNA helicase-2/ATP-dependent DNA helicase PcrA